MSILVAGPRRTCVLLLFWQRTDDACRACPRSLDEERERGPRWSPPCRLIASCRVQRDAIAMHW